MFWRERNYQHRTDLLNRLPIRGFSGWVGGCPTGCPIGLGAGLVPLFGGSGQGAGAAFDVPLPTGFIGAGEAGVAIVVTDFEQAVAAQAAQLGGADAEGGGGGGGELPGLLLAQVVAEAMAIWHEGEGRGGMVFQQP